MRSYFLLYLIVFSTSLQAQNMKSVEFPFALYSQIMEESTGNIVVSPLSAQYALSILAEGAKGYTQQEIIETLGYKTLYDLEISNQTSRETLSTIDRDITFETANSIWALPSVYSKEKFVENCSTYYDAEVFRTDISKREGLNLMDQWAAVNTHNRITSLGMEEDPARVFAVINTLYLKAPFAYPFYPTKDIFQNSDGCRVLVPMISQKESLRYTEVDGFEIVELPLGNFDYYDDGQYDNAKSYSMLIFSPIEEATYTPVTAETYQQALQTLTYDGDIDLTMPKFSLKTNKSITRELQKLGIRSLFSPNADFTNMTDCFLTVSEVKQLISFDVDEKGIEGAAATVVDIVLGLPHPQHKLVLNHPFQFVVKEENTGSILFIGSVNELEALDQIESMTTSGTSLSTTYDLSGRKTSSPTVRGIYIEGGKKVVR